MNFGATPVHSDTQPLSVTATVPGVGASLGSVSILVMMPGKAVARMLRRRACGTGVACRFAQHLAGAQTAPPSTWKDE
eukprot:CAMPEP_0204272066 /NCGR_PEP_ID=MMETSP0468-20130131/21880_1 /ASSEMBLY_ACC=CAM_ASM_000383 /TAXON_ID=2969 /ORGANISM="Oxyrrhis marina" /LENGTH=77 /DNA_ID=CAMNT_0051247869 /DNA_START=93 /DNA_END=327 /DNA_ORIENTATION=+